MLQSIPGGTLWDSKHITADRVRGRIDAILQRAVNHDLAPKNVAVGIKDDLPKVIHQPRHHPSMPFTQINEFLAYLRGSSRANLLTKLAIEFGVLTIARSGEVRGARWEEIKGSEWQLPAARTKQGRPHTIYLSSRAMEILAEARKLRSGPLIFWSAGQREMSGNTLNKSVKQHYVECFADDISQDDEIPTFQGFRASFKTWAEEKAESASFGVTTAEPSPVKEKWYKKEKLGSLEFAYTNKVTDAHIVLKNTESHEKGHPDLIVVTVLYRQLIASAYWELDCEPNKTIADNIVCSESGESAHATLRVEQPQWESSPYTRTIDWKFNSSGFLVEEDFGEWPLNEARQKDALQLSHDVDRPSPQEVKHDKPVDY